jgi:hypothetical protein
MENRVLDSEAVLAAAEEGDGTGFCIVCGAEHDGCEPDARRYECDHGCGRTVYGAEELVLMGYCS